MDSFIGKFAFPLILLSFLYSLGLSAQFTPGNIYFDETGFVEYRPGNLPVILSAPHGGNWSPDTIPDRNCTGCSYGIDSYTRVLTWGVYDAFFEQTGCYPHVIMNRLHREKFDANRDIGDAADGNPLIEEAWYNYHDFIDVAKAQITTDYGRGLFLDMHGHGHTIQRIELGYTLSATELAETDATLNSTAYIEDSSIRRLVGDNLQGESHSDLLRGSLSFGTLMEGRGYPCVPSSSDPFPATGDPYFSGGYNTGRHGSRNTNGTIDAIQLEFNQDIRFDALRRDTLIDSLTTTINEYINHHYFSNYSGSYCAILPVDLLDFSGKLEGRNVLLHWTTASEENNHYFEIQRSKDGLFFETIGRVEGSGNSSELIQYEFIDENPLAGNNYYRLKQVDFDGQYEYSKTIHIEWSLGQINFTRIFPNPTNTGSIFLEYQGYHPEDLNISIHDSSGKLVRQFRKSAISGNQNIPINIDGFGKGIYFIRIRTFQGIQVQKLIVE